MKQYNDQVADHPSVEMIHVSLDNDEKAALAWASQESFPWPTVMREKLGRSGLQDYTPRGIPGYKLVDKNGEVVAEGKGAVFNKVAELKKTEA